MIKTKSVYHSNAFDNIEELTKKEKENNQNDSSIYEELSDMSDDKNSTSPISQSNQLYLFESDTITKKIDSQINKIKIEKINQNNALFNRRQTIYSQFYLFFQFYNYCIKNLKNYQIVNLMPYGSIISGDSTFESDQDFLIVVYALKEDTNEEYELFLNQLIKNIKLQNGVQEVSKLKGSNYNYRILSIKYKFYENPQIFSIDFNFYKIYDLRIYQNINKNPIFKTISLKKYYYKKSPQLLGIYLILKQYLKSKNINISYKGGLSSTGLFYLLLAYYKKSEITDPSKIKSSFKLLYGFLSFIINFDFENYYIDINSEEIFLNKKENSIINEDPYIINPFSRIDSNIFSHNYPLKIQNIKKNFENIYEKLTNEIEKYEKGEDDDIDNIIKSIFFQ